MTTISFKGAPVHTGGSVPRIGAEAPDFILTDVELSDLSLKGLRGKKVILSINPSLDTSVCSLVLKKFNEEAKKHPEIFIAFVSADLPFAQKRLCIQEDLHNAKTLSTFRSKEFARDYGVELVDGPLKGLTARACIAIDEQGKVLYAELVGEITKEPDYTKALKACL